MVGGNTQVDLALPATVPIVAMIDEIAALIDGRTANWAEPEDAPIPTQHWTLARIGQEPIEPEATLAEAGVRDGELLVLRAMGSSSAPALFDDVIDAVARLTEQTFRAWTPAAARWAATIAAVLGTPAALVLLVLAKDHGQGWTAGGVAIGAGVAALVAAVIVARAYAQALPATVLTWCALLLIGPGAALFVPTLFGSAHLLLACAVALVVTVLAYRVTGVGATLTAAAMTVTVCGGLAALVVLLWHDPASTIGAGALPIGLVLLSGAARLAAAASRLPVPPVPTAGGRIDPADHEPRPTIEGIGAVGATAVAQAAGLADRARVANQFHSGIVIGATVVAATSALVAANSGADHRLPGMLLAAVAGVVLCLRARAFADLMQTSTLLAGGGITLCGLVIGMGLHGETALVAAAIALLVLVGGALAGGFTFGAADPSPVLRRGGELVEYALIVAIVPLTLWAMDLYALARSV
ncbi:type VII secretion integral membrane protein EccD [Nocardia albiluteola]|uniref:type VII secretion integral membrane protein EccD n=1 Tax=Nocardia albiluteola TaxID=2842303 RepID=UPI0027E0365A|nr:type VII secretion integral membrane protein EccD [Nocardia albiluteola]